MESKYKIKGKINGKNQESCNRNACYNLELWQLRNFGIKDLKKGKSKMNKIKRMAIVACVALLGVEVYADLDEKGFEFYKEGEITGQGSWSPEGLNEAKTGFDAKTGRVEIKKSDDKKNQWLEFKAGFTGVNQTRLLKGFPATTGKKAVVSFDFKPGAETLGGRMYFDQAGVGCTNLQFIKGTVNILEPGKADSTDTGVKFKADAFNHFDLFLDFEKKKVDIALDGVAIGKFDMPAKTTMLNFFNFYAGGNEPSCLDNLVVSSVDEFPKLEPKK